MNTDSFTNKKVLNPLKKSQYWAHAAISFIIFFIFLVVSSAIEKRHEQAVVGSIRAIFRDDRELQNTAYLSRRLADLESLGIIKCVEANIVSNQTLYSTKFKDACINRSLFIKILDPIISVNLSSITGEHIDINFRSDSRLILKIYIIILFILILIIANLVIALYSYRIFMNSKALNAEQLINKTLDFKVQEQSAQLVKIKIDAAIQNSMNQLSKQVAHDIRSPLSALSMIMGTLKDLPEEKRILIRNATQRINDIANDLLQKGKNLENEISARSNESTVDKLAVVHQGSPPQLAVEFIPALIDILVSEKRMQYREYEGLEIFADLKSSFGAFCNVNSNELKRIISNLINNSIEAFDNHQGVVTVGVKKCVIDRQPVVEIFVQDNGKGIPEHLIHKLGTAGASFGKSNSAHSGSGLGLFHAKKMIESFGGALNIESTVAVGSTIHIILPLVDAPRWFTDKIDLTGKRFLVSLDDDISIHQIWSERLHTLNIENLEHIRFQSVDAFERYVNSNILYLKETRFLIDYELLNQGKTGLDVIEDLGLEKYSILVTSRYDEDNIQERCSRLRLKVLPKSLAGFVPFDLQLPKETFDWVLIDDDELVHLTWQMAAAGSNKTFIGFKCPEEFNIFKQRLDHCSSIYIDSNLANGIKGEDVAQNLHFEGFHNLNLATGYSPDHFPKMSFVKAVVGKQPPNDELSGCTNNQSSLSKYHTAVDYH